ncbi:hypothetical protein EMIT0196P_120186 [Pseudomonas chlororaphis]
MTEGLTLLPAHGSDKRTKEVFALSLERMNAPASRAFARCIDGLDGRVSGGWIAPLQGMSARRALLLPRL